MRKHIKQEACICRKCKHFFPSFNKLTLGSCYKDNPTKQVSYQNTCKGFKAREAET